MKQSRPLEDCQCSRSRESVPKGHFDCRIAGLTCTGQVSPCLLRPTPQGPFLQNSPDIPKWSFSVATCGTQDMKPGPLPLCTRFLPEVQLPRQSSANLSGSKALPGMDTTRNPGLTVFLGVASLNGSGWEVGRRNAFLLKRLQESISIGRVKRRAV